LQAKTTPPALVSEGEVEIVTGGEPVQRRPDLASALEFVAALHGAK
jgi:hypothetical protein